jgi:hypothetical protein
VGGSEGGKGGGVVGEEVVESGQEGRQLAVGTSGLQEGFREFDAGAEGEREAEAKREAAEAGSGEEAAATGGSEEEAREVAQAELAFGVGQGTRLGGRQDGQASRKVGS